MEQHDFNAILEEITLIMEPYQDFIRNSEDEQDLLQKAILVYLDNLSSVSLKPEYVVMFAKWLEDEHFIFFENNIEQLLDQIIRIKDAVGRIDEEEEGSNTYFTDTPESGWVYVLMNPSMEGIVKVGMTKRNPEDRTHELSSATGVPTPFILVYKEHFSDCNTAEKLVHQILEDQGHRVSKNREFFNCPIPTAIQVIQQVKNSPSLFNNSTKSSDSFKVENINNDISSVIKDLIEEGEAYLNGYEDKIQNPKKGVELLKKAAKLGSAKAYWLLGQAHLDDLTGLKPNLQKALDFFSEGTEANGKESVYCFGEMAKIYSGYYSWLNDDVVNYHNADKCWKLYFKNLTLEQSDHYYMTDYLSFYVKNGLNVIYKQQISWEKYNILESLGNSIHSHVNGPYSYMAEPYKNARKYLLENFIIEKERDMGIKGFELKNTVGKVLKISIEGDYSRIRFKLEHGFIKKDDILNLSHYITISTNVVKILNNEGIEVERAEEGEEVYLIVPAIKKFIGPEPTVYISGSYTYKVPSSEHKPLPEKSNTRLVQGDTIKVVAGTRENLNIVNDEKSHKEKDLNFDKPFKDSSVSAKEPISHQKKAEYKQEVNIELINNPLESRQQKEPKSLKEKVLKWFRQ